MKKIKKEICKKNNYIVTDYSFEIKYDKITPDVLENLLILIKNQNVNILIKSILNFDDEILNGIINTCMNDYYKKSLIKIANNMRKIIENDGEEIFRNFNNIKFAQYINTLDNSFFDKKFNLYTFIKNYNFNTTISNFYTNKKIFNKYVIDPQRREYKMDDINKYEEIREKHFINLINNNDDNIVEKIISSYFNYDYDTFKNLIFKIEKMNIKINNKKMFNYLINIEKYNNEELIKYIKNIKNYPDYFKTIEKTIKEESIKDIVNNLTIINNNNKIITYDSEPFTFLIHRIKGLLKNGIYEMLKNDIKNWDKYYEENGYISCSLINELYIACTPGDYLTIGFSNIKPNDILAMNNKDMNFLKHDLYTNNNDKISNYMGTEMLLNTSGLYNEIVLNRYRDKLAIMPDYILAFDKIGDKEKQASEELNIPICLIILDAYADIMIDILQKLKKTNYEKYLLMLERFNRQISFGYKEMNDYYNKIVESEALKSENDEVNDLIEKMNSKIKKKI